MVYDAYQFNVLSTLDKLKVVVGEINGIAMERVDTEHMPYTLSEIAEMIDTVSKYPTEHSDCIKLVQFLDNEQRGNGCKWCGG